MYSILIIEDEQRVADLLRVGLEENGYNCLVAYDGAMGLRMFRANTFDLVISDIVLPKMDGFELCKEIRAANPAIPILMLTALGSTDDKLDGFDAGADDYLSKPFGIGELQARLRVALRRHSATAAPDPLVKFSDVTVDLAARVIHRGEEEVHLTPIEFRLLAVLLNNAGKVLTQRQLLNQVWGPNAVEHSHYLRIYMGHLRQKLEQDPARPRHFITETGIGYRFMP